MTGFWITEDDITTKPKFVVALRRFLSTGETTTPYDNGEYLASPGTLKLIAAFVDYLEAHTEIPDKNPGINWFHDLAPYLVDAFIEFRTHTKHAELRRAYQHETNNEIPDLLDIRGQVARSCVTRDLIDLMPLVAGRCGGAWLARELTAYLNGEYHVIYHAWRNFLRVCYRPMVAQWKTNMRSRVGTFGRTMLSVGFGGGRMQFTFERTDKIPDVEVLEKVAHLVEVSNASAENRLAALQALFMTRKSATAGRVAQSVMFLGDESDLSGCRSGLYHSSEPYAQVVEMINDVVANWNPDELR